MKTRLRKSYREQVALYKECDELRMLLNITGLKSAELAERVNTKPERITEYLHGKHAIKLITLKYWCEVLDVDIRELFPPYSYSKI